LKIAPERGLFFRKIGCFDEKWSNIEVFNQTFEVAVAKIRSFSEVP